MTKRIFIFFWLAQSALGAPTFECSSPHGEIFRIWIGQGRNHMQIAKEGKTRQISLSPANLTIPASATRPLIYVGYRPDVDDGGSLFDLSSEVDVRYVLAEGRARVALSLVYEDRERLDLKCRATGLLSEVEPLWDAGSFPKRMGEMMESYATHRDFSGQLDSIVSLGIAATVRRIFADTNLSESESRSSLLDKIKPALFEIDPRSIRQLEASLPSALHGNWKNMLTQSGYALYPETARFASWVQEGCRAEHPDLASVFAGFDNFRQSTAFGDEGMRSLFTDRVTPSLKLLNEFSARIVENRMNGDASTFFWQLWAKTNGKRTLADVPEVAELAGDLGKLAVKEDFDPQQIQTRLSDFLHSPLAADPDTLQLFVHAAGPRLKQLTPRQKEDVLGWLEDPSERKFFTELVK